MTGTPQPEEAARRVADEAKAGDELSMGALMAALDWIADGVAVCDSDGAIVIANASAKAIHDRTAASSTQLTAAIQCACRQDQRRLIELFDGGEPHFATIVPLAVGARRAAIVVHGRRQLCGPVELQMYASRLGLTPTESQVLRHLTDGLRPAEIAAAHQVSITTVLSQVAALRSKTSTTSVQQLLRRVSKLPAIRARVESRRRLDVAAG